MAAVAIAATKVQAYSAQAPVVFRLFQKLLARTAADSATARPQLLSTPENWCLICCLPADAAGEPGGPLYYKEVLTRFYLEFFYPHDSEHECIRGILWVVQSIDLWRVSQSLDDTMKYSDRHLAGLSAGPPDRVELIGAGSLGYGTGPSFG
ncbi:hypothetical protein EMIHUDRAFT_251163 [Emiliania huxleyi CCMP1516]|uniref:Uncharacterized protein n=2 Tax=Emiliania huxleyi TaxID=2903 RepID=A0A0D3KXG2_EMIH1|nr:hypothetical protein EMIHUDRAFT_251163 [Emiliania huxleyi CCMP1516]EOD40447.1 hypothetical protein EMIHUDRAFT_251163 [Emiliania huxleyi CCMP1516]|eukprot:XP_005792876.1 hypothetical protein EMIHUDRAFT_251163 [Emiliania huxleyi CCMP1516]